jgi:hypothetical protein
MVSYWSVTAGLRLEALELDGLKVSGEAVSCIVARHVALVQPEHLAGTAGEYVTRQGGLHVLRPRAGSRISPCCNSRTYMAHVFSAV